MQSLVCAYDFDKSIKNSHSKCRFVAAHMVRCAWFSPSLCHCRLVCFIITALSKSVLCSGPGCLFLFLLLLCCVTTPLTSGLACVTPALVVALRCFVSVCSSSLLNVASVSSVMNRQLVQVVTLYSPHHDWNGLRPPFIHS